jgi:transcriptional regulator with XRE-family HTH domain
MQEPRLRQIRHQQGLTLQQVASATGLSMSMLSQVERGLTDPSLDALRQLAAALHVTLTDLFHSEEPVDVAVVRREERIQVRAPHGELAFTRLSPGFGTAEILEGELAAGGQSSRWLGP